MTHIYFYEYTKENFREVIITPINRVINPDKNVKDLEGIIITEKEIDPRYLHKGFSIIYEERTLKKYNGIKYEFRP